MFGVSKERRETEPVDVLKPEELCQVLQKLYKRTGIMKQVTAIAHIFQNL